MNVEEMIRELKKHPLDKVVCIPSWGAFSKPLVLCYENYVVIVPSEDSVTCLERMFREEEKEETTNQEGKGSYPTPPGERNILKKHSRGDES